MPHTRYPVRNVTAPHFLTTTVVGWYPLFKDPALAEIVLEALRYRVEQGRWTIYAYVVMTHHLHWVVQARDLRAEARSFKAYTARRIVDTLQAQGAEAPLRALRAQRARWKRDQTHQVWTDGVRAKELFSTPMAWQKIHYIHRNPVAAGHVTAPQDWPYSSAQDYAGRQGPVPVVPAF
jgi:REP element-mobilizing transposase RayT